MVPDQPFLSIELPRADISVVSLYCRIWQWDYTFTLVSADPAIMELALSTIGSYTYHAVCA